MSLIESIVLPCEICSIDKCFAGAMFSFQQPLGKLNASEVPGIDKAIANADAFAAELVAKLHPAGGESDD